MEQTLNLNDVDIDIFGCEFTCIGQIEEELEHVNEVISKTEEAIKHALMHNAATKYLGVIAGALSRSYGISSQDVPALEGVQAEVNEDYLEPEDLNELLDDISFYTRLQVKLEILLDTYKHEDTGKSNRDNTIEALNKYNNHE